MALTYSEMIPLGKKAAPFELMGIDGEKYSLNNFNNAKALVVMFICKHCPYVQAIEKRIAVLAKEYQQKGVAFVGINSNDTNRYPEDSPENMKKQSQAVGFTFPYLIDDLQNVAKSYGAVCTPDFFVFDHNHVLRYRGRLDDNWKEESKVQTQDLKIALDALVENKSVTDKQFPSMGCSIKWK